MRNHLRKKSTKSEQVKNTMINFKGLSKVELLNKHCIVKKDE